MPHDRHLENGLSTSCSLENGLSTPCSPPAFLLLPLWLCRGSAPGPHLCPPPRSHGCCSCHRLLNGHRHSAPDTLLEGSRPNLFFRPRDPISVPDTGPFGLLSQTPDLTLPLASSPQKGAHSSLMMSQNPGPVSHLRHTSSQGASAAWWTSTSVCWGSLLHGGPLWWSPDDLSSMAYQTPLQITYWPNQPTHSLVGAKPTGATEPRTSLYVPPG